MPVKLAGGPPVTITYPDGRSETLTVEEFRRRKRLLWCRRCDTYHPPTQCVGMVVSSAARKRAAIERYTPRYDGIAAL